MRLPNKYGGIVKNGGNRRKPFQVRITAGYNDNGTQIYKTLGFYAKKEDAINALSQYHKNPLDLTNNKITFLELYNTWSEEHFPKIRSKWAKWIQDSFKLL